VNFAFDEDQELLRDSARRFLGARASLAALRPNLEAGEVVDRAVWREGAELGLTAMLVPAEYGGGSVTEQPLVDLVVIAEELGRVLYAGPFVPTNVVADAIARFGTDDQRTEHLPGLAAGDVVAAWCLTGDGSTERESVDVVAAADRDGYRLTGSAAYVHGGRTADVLLVAARSDAGLVHLLVPAGSAGIAAHDIAGLDLTRRFAELTFDDVAAPASAAVGVAGDDALLARALDVAIVLQAAEAVGAGDYLLSETVQYAKDRVQFGRPIGSFQAIKHRLADLHISVEAMRAATHYAALALADDRPDRDEAVAVAGSFVVDAQAHLAGEALQLHGGIGFTWEHDVHLFIRRAKVDQVLYGEPELHRERLCRVVERTEAG
jgi:alkylation response protein AidB-like acyl-CoA dehydrogenase